MMRGHAQIDNVGDVLQHLHKGGRGACEGRHCTDTTRQSDDCTLTPCNLKPTPFDDEHQGAVFLEERGE